MVLGCIENVEGREIRWCEKGVFRVSMEVFRDVKEGVGRGRRVCRKRVSLEV